MRSEHKIKIKTLRHHRCNHCHTPLHNFASFYPPNRIPNNADTLVIESLAVIIFARLHIYCACCKYSKGFWTRKNAYLYSCRMAKLFDLDTFISDSTYIDIFLFFDKRKLCCFYAPLNIVDLIHRPHLELQKYRHKLSTVLLKNL